MHSIVVLHSLRVILLQNCLMLSEQRTFLLLDNVLNALFFQSLGSEFLHLCFALLLINSQFFLPKSLNLSFMLKFTHAASLGIHLLEPFILCEFFHQLAFKFILHSLFFLSALRL